MRVAVPVFPGSNCDHDALHACGSVMGWDTKAVWHQEKALPEGTDLVFIPGGFSYGDYLRCGAIAKVSPIVPAIRRHAERGGYVLGVCNGFQILTEVGLLPGALTRNLHLRFECREIHVRVTAQGPFTPLTGRVWRLPIAHAEGRYQASGAVLAELEEKGLVALRYCDARGDLVPTANPNGSLHSIAGIYGGSRKNVLGLMPHPERLAEAILGGTDGRELFANVAAA